MENFDFIFVNKNSVSADETGRVVMVVALVETFSLKNNPSDPAVRRELGGRLTAGPHYSIPPPPSPHQGLFIPP